MATEREMLAALDKIENTVLAPREAAIAVPDMASLCGTYRTIRPLLETALPLVKQIPVVGAKIANAISFLMTLADLAYPTT